MAAAEMARRKRRIQREIVDKMMPKMTIIRVIKSYFTILPPGELHTYYIPMERVYVLW